ncbi:MAG TPA: hypothetical protein PLE78_07160 [Flavobacteriales bacterium]|nr:hypothetical protein [Flavobacteriales bacterium]HQW41630.1 hypothetical protein [Flavobacteriales bacterium]
MEPKYLTILQAAAIALVLAVVVIAHSPSETETVAGTELAAQH